MDHLHWILAAAVVLLGLFVYGFGDLIRFSLIRAWAISGVCFAESIRRRVLWITPLAILGIVAITLLQKPTDEQDAIRQTIKFSLFAAGMVVTVTAVILACTNLPREIDSRVIYTIVTKPTTRLEIVVGKVIGFAKVSLAILLIMGVFTAVYVRGWATHYRRDITSRLAAGAIDPLSRPTYEYWAKEGLLRSRSFAVPVDFQIYSRLPVANDSRRWFFGSNESDMIVPFYPQPEDLIPSGVPNANPGDGGIFIRVLVGFDRSDYRTVSSESDLPPMLTAPTTEPSGPPTSAAIAIEILDENFNTLISSNDINDVEGGRTLTLTDPSGRTPVVAFIKPEVSLNLLRSQVFYVAIKGISQGVEFSAQVEENSAKENVPVSLAVRGAGNQVRMIPPMHNGVGNEYHPSPPSFRSRAGSWGQRLRGGKPGAAPIGVISFRGSMPRDVQDGAVAFELRSGVERGGEDGADDDSSTQVELTIVNRATGQSTGPFTIYPENNRTTYFNIPATALGQGDFDVHMRNFTRGHYLNLRPDNLSMVFAEQSFDWNLIKSLSILWLLSILVVVISIFCSTFLSWPIAIMLTMTLLLGHWGVIQLGDALAPGIGHQVAQDLFGASDASRARVVSASVEAMSRVLDNLASVLPDIGQFSAIEDLERGLSISPNRLLAPLGVLMVFGVPLVVLSYVILRNKEVAP